MNLFLDIDPASQKLLQAGETGTKSPQLESEEPDRKEPSGGIILFLRDARLAFLVRRTKGT